MAKIDTVLAQQETINQSFLALTDAVNKHSEKINTACVDIGALKVGLEGVKDEVKNFRNHPHEGLSTSIENLKTRADNKNRENLVVTAIGLILAAVFGWRMPQ